MGIYLVDIDIKILNKLKLLNVPQYAKVYI